MLGYQLIRAGNISASSKPCPARMEKSQEAGNFPGQHRHMRAGPMLKLPQWADSLACIQ